MSKIKGGGRAQLTQEAEESIISLLYDLRDHKNPLLSAETPTESSSGDGTIEDSTKDNERKFYCDLSDHDKKKERKRFLKRLLKCHNRLMLSNKLNQTPKETLLHTTSSTAPATANRNVHNDGESSDITGKIRIQLVEMIFKEKKDKPKKDEKKKSSKKVKKTSWKEGGKKIIVLPRNTSVKQLMVLCKGKLQMKKPSRIFIMDTDSNLEMELVHDLRGLQDGSTVYVTSYCPPPTKGTSKNTSNHEQDNLQKEEEEVVVVDPLENIKKAYRMCSHKKRKTRKTQFVNERLPPFSDALGELEPLSESRAKLPAAKYRSEILKSLDSSRVIVISGATGCG